MNNNEEEIRELLKAVYRPETASPEFKERLFKRLPPAISREARGAGGALWRQVRLWSPVVAVIALAIIGCGVWLSLTAIPGVLPLTAPEVILSPMLETAPSSTLAPESTSPLTPATELPESTVLSPESTPSPTTPELTTPPMETPASTPPSAPTSELTPSPAPAPAQAGTLPLAQPLSTGRVEVRVTDAPPKKEVTSINVTVASVEIHKAGASADDESGWLPMKLSGANTFDLLQVRGLESVLATGDLTPGTYTQIRMDVTKVGVTFKGSQPEAAKLPSDKLKFTQPFEVVAGQTTVLLFDFDALKSLNVTGWGRVMFKPVIQLTVNKPQRALEITTPSLPNGEVGIAYNATLAAMGGQTPYTWSIATGKLPTGLSLNASTGVISGMPTAAGSFTFTLKVEDSSPVKKNATKSFTVAIAPATLQIISTTLPDGRINVAYSTTVQANGGISPYTWGISAGNLPAGLTLNASTGVISGTPTATGDFNFTVMVTDSASPAKNDTQNFAIHIAA